MQFPTLVSVSIGRNGRNSSDLVLQHSNISGVRRIFSESARFAGQECNGQEGVPDWRSVGRFPGRSSRHLNYIQFFQHEHLLHVRGRDESQNLVTE